MNNLKNMDLKYIDKNGVYINMDIPMIYHLSDTEILSLRQYYKNEKIAVNRKISLKSADFIKFTNKHNKTKYKITRKRIVEENVKIKDAPKNSKTYSIIVGGMAISLFLFSNMAIINTLTEREKLKHQNIIDDIQFFTLAPEIVENSSDKVEKVDEEKEEIARLDEEYARVQTIKYFCNIYQVNFDVVYPILASLTDNFSNEDYLNGHIEGVNSKEESIDAQLENELLLYAVRSMKQSPNQLDIREELLNENELYKKNGYVSPEDYIAQIGVVSKVIGVDRCLLYAIIQTECNFDGTVFNELNNSANLKHPDTGKYLVFDTKEEGFFELAIELKKYYHMIKENPNNINYDILKKIRDLHIPGNDVWLKGVVENLEYAQLHEDELFGAAEVNHSTIKM